MDKPCEPIWTSKPQLGTGILNGSDSIIFFCSAQQFSFAKLSLLR
jgi:hypothetical protein